MARSLKREIIRHFVDADPRSRRMWIAKNSQPAHLRRIHHGADRGLPVGPTPSPAPETIREMREKGYLVATTTGFDRAITASIFDRLEWKKYFAASICSDDVTEGQPSPLCFSTRWRRPG